MNYLDTVTGGIEAYSSGSYLSSVLWHCWLDHLTSKNSSPIWPIMCLVQRQTLLNFNFHGDCQIGNAHVGMSRQRKVSVSRASATCQLIVTIYNQSQLAERKHVARYWSINTAVTAVPLIAHPSPIEPQPSQCEPSSVNSPRSFVHLWLCKRCLLVVVVLVEDVYSEVTKRLWCRLLLRKIAI